MSLTIQSTGSNSAFNGTSTMKLPAAIDWKMVATRTRDEIFAKIPTEYLVPQNLLKPRNLANLAQISGILSSRELSIINSTATELLSKIHTSYFTSVEVTIAFCKSAAIAHQATNCVALIMFEEALAAARDLDDFIRVNGKPKGPLHGLPISVKEHVFLAGTPSTSGFVAWANDVSPSDALVVKILRDAGAVFHVKTTNPQGLMALETVSNLYGTTTNPYNTDLTSGGSSGGEAALIAMRGSLLGIGTDIGGSIRAPAAFCGIFGLKPSVARLPHGGLSGAHGGMENIIGCVGPMATAVEDLKLFCKVLLDSEPWLPEPSLVEMPWKSAVVIPSSLKIGVMWNDGVVLPHPPVTRCLQATVTSLQQAGHTIINWDSALHRDLTSCVEKMYFLDGGKEYTDICEAGNEPAAPLLRWILDRADPKPYTAAESWKLNSLRNALQIVYATQWNESGIDALLCPVHPSVASAHGESTYWGYTSAFNILDYSAAVFPVGKVDSTDSWNTFPRQSRVASEEDAQFESYYGSAGEQKYQHAPVSLQLVTRRYREEILLEMVDRILQDLKPTGDAHMENYLRTLE